MRPASIARTQDECLGRAKMGVLASFAAQGRQVARVSGLSRSIRQLDVLVQCFDHVGRLARHRSEAFGHDQRTLYLTSRSSPFLGQPEGCRRAGAGCSEEGVAAQKKMPAEDSAGEVGDIRSRLVCGRSRNSVSSVWAATYSPLAKARTARNAIDRMPWSLAV
jgi:hypothetical protein